MSRKVLKNEKNMSLHLKQDGEICCLSLFLFSFFLCKYYLDSSEAFGVFLHVGKQRDNALKGLAHITGQFTGR